MGSKIYGKIKHRKIKQRSYGLADDPAVGFAHFLESAINVLLNIYEKLWQKAKELKMKKGFGI